MPALLLRFYQSLYVLRELFTMSLMTTSNQQVRRATVEDLPKLVPLWKTENLPCESLEKRFKEFQVVEGANGELLGALGLQIAGLEGQLHSEVFAHFEQADALREKLLERAQVLAKNHGLVRIWTQLATPFWHRNGFQYAGPELLSKLPAVFAGAPQPWLFVQLKEESAPATSIDKEFAMFKEAEKERTDQLFRRARVLKMVAALVAVCVLLLVVVWAVLFLKAQSRGRISPVPSERGR